MTPTALNPADGLRFTKGHGTQNDFVLLFDEHGDVELTPALVRALCDRRAGIGADGVIRAVRVGAAAAVPEPPQGHPDGRWFMDYWNSDGSLSEMCGNGARVFAALLERDAGETLEGGLTIATRGGERTLSRVGDGRYSVTMGAWAVPAADAGADAEVTAAGMSGHRPALSVDVGNPHTVVALAEPEELTALDLTTPPQVVPAPPYGGNVEFVVPLETSASRGRVRMRVHERGSGETRSCGTGACAVALAVRAWAGPEAPDVWDVEVPGGEVTVRIVGGETVLEGPAVLVADGVVDPGGLA